MMKTFAAAMAIALAAAALPALAQQAKPAAPAAKAATDDRYIGYYGPYATSHDALDADTELQQEVRSAARALVEAVRLSRAGQLPDLETDTDPRPK